MRDEDVLPEPDDSFACEVVPPERRATPAEVTDGAYATIETIELPDGRWRAVAGSPFDLAFEADTEAAAKVGLVHLFAERARTNPTT